MAEQVVSVEGLVSVTGTVGTTPSGTQNVAITGQPITTTINGQPLSTYSTTNPAFTGFYVYSIGDVAGVVAANNYLSLFNPVGSGKLFAFGGAFISSHVAADITAGIGSVQGRRVTTATGGTLAVNSTDVAKFQTTAPASVAELRTANPTVTIGAQMFNSPPIEGAGKTSTGIVHSVTVPPGAGLFSFAPGEGIVLRTLSGDVDQRWNFSIVWGEM